MLEVAQLNRRGTLSWFVRYLCMAPESRVVSNKVQLMAINYRQLLVANTSILVLRIFLGNFFATVNFNPELIMKNI